MAATTDFSVVNLILKKLDEARNLITHNETIRSLHALSHVLELRVSHDFREENRNTTDIKIHKVASSITNSEDFKGQFGPVSFALGENKKMLGFLNTMMAAAAELSGGNREEMLQKGDMFLEAGQHDKARDIFDALLAMFPDDVNLRMSIGELYMKHDLYEDAELLFRQAQGLDPDSIHIINRLGIAFRKMKRYDDAVAEYIKAIKLDPSDPHLYYNLAVAFYSKEDYEKALKTVERALSI